MVRFKYLRFIPLGGVLIMDNGDNTVSLRISKKDAKGYYVCSVPLQKLERIASNKHRYWEFKDGWLILHSY